MTDHAKLQKGRTGEKNIFDAIKRSYLSCLQIQKVFDLLSTYGSQCPAVFH